MFSDVCIRGLCRRWNINCSVSPFEYICVFGLFELITELLNCFFFLRLRVWTWIFLESWIFEREKKKSFSSVKTKCLSWAVRIICSRQPCKRCQKNHPATNPLLFSMLNNGWRKPMNPWANGLYSRLSARIRLTHRPFPSSSTTHTLSALCVCVSVSAGLYAHRLTAQHKMA